MAVVQSERIIASDLFVEGPTPARYWGDQWLRVSEKLLKGLNLQLTNRVASLEAAVALMKMDVSGGAVSWDGLTSEIALLHELMHLYRALPADPIEEPATIRLQDLAPQVVRLHACHADLRHVPCVLDGEPETEPVFVRPSALHRCILVLLASAAGNTHRARRNGSVTLTYGMAGSDVYVRLRGDAPSGQLLFSGEGSLLHAVHAALAHAQATADGSIRRSEAGDAIEYELRIPALSSARTEEAN